RAIFVGEGPQPAFDSWREVAGPPVKKLIHLIGPSEFIGHQIPFPGATLHGGDGQFQTRFAFAHRIFDPLAPGDVDHAADDARHTPRVVAHQLAPIPDPEVAAVLVAEWVIKRKIHQSRRVPAGSRLIYE